MDCFIDEKFTIQRKIDSGGSDLYTSARCLSKGDYFYIPMLSKTESFSLGQKKTEAFNSRKAWRQ